MVETAFKYIVPRVCQVHHPALSSHWANVKAGADAAWQLLDGLASQKLHIPSNNFIIIE